MLIMTLPPLQLCSMAGVVGAATPPGYVMCILGVPDEQLHIANAEEPTTLAYAMQEAIWRKAMEEELQVTEENLTWTLTELLAGR
jgi:hypothetical protein